MKMLAFKGKFSYIKMVTVNFINSFVLSKQKNVTFANICHPHKTKKLELVHLDIYGLNSIFSSMGGSQYYVTIIDDFM